MNVNRNSNGTVSIENITDNEASVILAVLNGVVDNTGANPIDRIAAGLDRLGITVHHFAFSHVNEMYDADMPEDPFTHNLVVED